MTERLYYNDSHLLEFNARVISVTLYEDGRAAVVLDRTAFYPTGGGQPTDTGTLGAGRVVECVDLEDEGVLHIIEGEAPEVGQEVAGRIDRARRLDHMQQHTGQHILSQAFIALYNAETRGFRLLSEVSEIDLALDNPTDERIQAAVELANRIIWEDRPVRALSVTAEEAARLPLRKEPARTGALRLIEIEGFDLTPCGGTHAHHAGEVGIIAVRSWERAKGLTRLEFVAGRRALADYARVNRTAREVAALFSTARDESAAAVKRLFEENKALHRRLRELEETIARYEAGELLAEATRRRDGSRIIARVFEGRTAESLKRLALALIAHEGTIALLGSREGEEARLVFARAADAPGDMGALMREACASFGGRGGGGRADMAQGGGRAVGEQLAAIIEAAARKVESS